MIDSKILIPLFGLLASVYAINDIQEKKYRLKENYTTAWGLPKGINLESVYAPNRQAAAAGQFQSLGNNYQNIIERDIQNNNTFYTVPGQLQSLMSPRMFGGDYGANITYNLPSVQNLAVPTSPLDYANSASAPAVTKQVKENYPVTCGEGGKKLSYNGGAPLMAGGFAAGNYNEKLDEVYSGSSSVRASNAVLPVGDMTSLNSLGEEDQPIVYDRYLFANLNSRLRSQGDPIRGDLPIVPQNSGWFNVSVQPNLDLQQGALNVLAGSTNETAQQLADLIYTSSGNSKTTIGGLNMVNSLGNPVLRGQRRSNALRMSNSYAAAASAAGGDVSITAFP